MLKSDLCDYGNTYTLVKDTITIAPVPPPAAILNDNDVEIVFKNCARFTDCIKEINNTQIGNAKSIDVVMPIFNLTEYRDNYSKTFGSLWQYRNEQTLTDSGTFANFHAANDSASFKFKRKIIAGETTDGGTENIEMMMPLKYLCDIWKTLEMHLINYEINLVLTWSEKCVLSNDTKATIFAKTDAKLYVLAVTLLTQDNAKLLHQSTLGFETNINQSISTSAKGILRFLDSSKFPRSNQIFCFLI